MIRTRNSDEFLIRIRGIRKAYEGTFGPMLARIRSQYAGKPEQDTIDQSLEIHAREYIVNSILASLNWRLDTRPEDGLPNLIPEAPIRSDERNTIRFLDYLGHERSTEKPLLLIETKRRSSGLPGTFKTYSTYSEIFSRGLSGESLSGDWKKWLQDLKDYLHSVFTRSQIIPKHVVVTNGDWLVLFLDPADAFFENGNRSPNRILVFSDYVDMERRSHELFEHLEYNQVLGETPPLTPGELCMYLDPSDIDKTMHGLRLQYIELTDFYSGHSPMIRLAPLLFIHSQYGGWLRIVMPPYVFTIPHELDRLPLHLDDVQKAANELLSDVNRRLGISLEPFPLLRHYADEDGFETLRGVFEWAENEYFIVTGERTHYLLPQPTIDTCPYHDWSCNSQGIASNPGPILVRSVSPRSFFKTPESHYCAHMDVTTSKAMPINNSNRSRCGPRSGKDGQAFCEIWRFETHLCCRTCAFQEVCMSAEVFRLPCIDRLIDTNGGTK